jgi:hypothetical protein
VGWRIGEAGLGGMGYGIHGGVIYKKDAGPSIIYATPSGGVGDFIAITGFDYGLNQGSSYVSFGGVRATEYDTWTNKRIVVKVPPGVDGTVEIAVATSVGASNTLPFSAGYPSPAVTAIIPSSGVNQCVSRIVGLSGTDFRPGASVALRKAGEVDIYANDV